MLSSRRVDALVKMARLTLEREALLRASGEMSDLTVLTLVNMLVATTVKVAHDTATPVQAAAFEKRLKEQVESTEWSMSGSG